jgi:ADP-ribosylglycohydrolase
LVRIVGIGGDTDTNGCIGAVLLGARFDEEAIPKDWIETVLNAPVDRDYPFMEPIKNKTVDEFIVKLANLS